MADKILLTAGSGPSCSSWPHWPTWTKLVPMLYNCRVLDASAPAAGNRYLYRSILTRLENIEPALILVQWNFDKFDVYVEQPKFADQILNGTSIRNFLLDIHTGKTTTGAGYWCSSKDNTVPWKKYYNEHVRSETGTALDDLEAMVSLQNLCYKKNLPYKFFTHDDIDHEFLSTNIHTRHFYNEIDWSLQEFDSVRTMYANTESYQYDTSGKTKEYQQTPNADFQYWFAEEELSDLLTSIGISKRNSSRRQGIKEYCHSKTLEIYGKVQRVE